MLFRSNGENLLLIKDQRIATAYMVEALRIFDAYQFRVTFGKPAPAAPGAPPPKPRKKELAVPPLNSGDPAAKPWWDKFLADPIRKRDREMFA